jgi:diguanylate cyclase (GGDEF)-like protein/PAS domain S-box-containing protein
MHTKLPDLQSHIVDLLLDAVFMVDTHGRIVYVNAACERIFGYTPDEMVGRFMVDFVLPEDRERTREEAVQVLAGHARVGFENHYIRKDGRIACIMWSARLSEVDQLRIGVGRDITEHKRAEARQAATYAISEAAHVAVDLDELLHDIHQIVAKLVPAASFAVAMSDEDTGRLSFPYQLSSHGDSPLAHQAAVHRICVEVVGSGRSLLLSGLPPAFPEAGFVSPDHGESWLAVPLIARERVLGALIVRGHNGMPYTEEDKDLLQFVSSQVATAIDRRRLHEELLRKVQYDELTGLPNRRLLYDRVEIALARTRREHGRLALLYIDMDDFKKVNDVLGHAAGDLLLQEVARRLKHSVREEDTAARLGGDEFVVLLEHIQHDADATTIAEKIWTAVSRPISIDGHLLRLQPSIGIALYPEHGTGVEQLLKHADNAMYKVKKSRFPAPE